jgi:hypothetical protein
MGGLLLKDPGPLRKSLYADAPVTPLQPQEVEAHPEHRALLASTQIILPVPVPYKGTPVFHSDEQFAKTQREAALLADQTPLGLNTPYRPGFKPGNTLNRIPPPGWAGKKPEVLASVTPVRPNRDVKVQYRDAIASIESRGSGDYGAVGPKHKTLGRALGRYQMMEGNIGSWSQEALGRELTVEQFLNSPKAQDIIFDHVFSGYVEEHGSPEAAAQAWFAGPGGVGKTGRKDVLGTSVGEYGREFQVELDRLNGK